MSNNQEPHESVNGLKSNKQDAIEYYDFQTIFEQHVEQRSAENAACIIDETDTTLTAPGGSVLGEEGSIRSGVRRYECHFDQRAKRRRISKPVDMPPVNNPVIITIDDDSPAQSQIHAMDSKESVICLTDRSMALRPSSSASSDDEEISILSACGPSFPRLDASSCAAALSVKQELSGRPPSLANPEPPPSARILWVDNVHKEKSFRSSLSDNISKFNGLCEKRGIPSKTGDDDFDMEAEMERLNLFAEAYTKALATTSASIVARSNGLLGQSFREMSTHGKREKTTDDTVLPRRSNFSIYYTDRDEFLPAGVVQSYLESTKTISVAEKRSVKLVEDANSESARKRLSPGPSFEVPPPAPTVDSDPIDVEEQGSEDLTLSEIIQIQSANRTGPTTSAVSKEMEKVPSPIQTKAAKAKAPKEPKEASVDRIRSKTMLPVTPSCSSTSAEATFSYTSLFGSETSLTTMYVAPNTGDKTASKPVSEPPLTTVSHAAEKVERSKEREKERIITEKVSTKAAAAPAVPPPPVPVQTKLKQKPAPPPPVVPTPPARPAVRSSLDSFSQALAHSDAINTAKKKAKLAAKRAKTVMSASKSKENVRKPSADSFDIDNIFSEISNSAQERQKAKEGDTAELQQARLRVAAEERIAISQANTVMPTSKVSLVKSPSRPRHYTAPTTSSGTPSYPSNDVGGQSPATPIQSPRYSSHPKLAEPGPARVPKEKAINLPTSAAASSSSSSTTTSLPSTRVSSEAVAPVSPSLSPTAQPSPLLPPTAIAQKAVPVAVPVSEPTPQQPPPAAQSALLADQEAEDDDPFQACDVPINYDATTPYPSVENQSALKVCPTTLPPPVTHNIEDDDPFAVPAGMDSLMRKDTAAVTAAAAEVTKAPAPVSSAEAEPTPPPQSDPVIVEEHDDDPYQACDIPQDYSPPLQAAQPAASGTAPTLNDTDDFLDDDPFQAVPLHDASETPAALARPTQLISSGPLNKAANAATAADFEDDDPFAVFPGTSPTPETPSNAQHAEVAAVFLSSADTNDPVLTNGVPSKDSDAAKQADATAALITTESSSSIPSDSTTTTTTTNVSSESVARVAPARSESFNLEDPFEYPVGNIPVFTNSGDAPHIELEEDPFEGEVKLGLRSGYQLLVDRDDASSPEGSSTANNDDDDDDEPVIVPASKTKPKTKDGVELVTLEDSDEETVEPAKPQKPADATRPEVSNDKRAKGMEIITIDISDDSAESSPAVSPAVAPPIPSPPVPVGKGDVTATDNTVTKNTTAKDAGRDNHRTISTSASESSTRPTTPADQTVDQHSRKKHSRAGTVMPSIHTAAKFRSGPSTSIRESTERREKEKKKLAADRDATQAATVPDQPLMDMIKRLRLPSGTSSSSVPYRSKTVFNSVPLKHKSIVPTSREPVQALLRSAGIVDSSVLQPNQSYPSSFTTADAQMACNDLGSHSREEMNWINSMKVPQYGGLAIDRFEYPFGRYDGMYWPIFQPTDALSGDRADSADVQNQLTCLTACTYSQKKDLFCDSHPDRWQKEFAAAWSMSDSQLKQNGRFRNRVAFARKYANESEEQAREKDKLRQQAEQEWMDKVADEPHIEVRNVDREEDRGLRERTEDARHPRRVRRMDQLVDMNMVDRYSSCTRGERGERYPNPFPRHWMDTGKELYVPANDRRRYLVTYVNHFNNSTVRAMPQNTRDPFKVLEWQKPFIQAAFVHQRGNLFPMGPACVMSKADQAKAAARRAEIEKRLAALKESGKPLKYSELRRLVALQAWEEKYWTIIWDSLVSVYKKYPPVSAMMPGLKPFVDKAFTSIATPKSRESYFDTYTFSKNQLRRQQSEEAREQEQQRRRQQSGDYGGSFYDRDNYMPSFRR